MCNEMHKVRYDNSLKLSVNLCQNCTNCTNCIILYVLKKRIIRFYLRFPYEFNRSLSGYIPAVKTLNKTKRFIGTYPIKNIQISIKRELSVCTILTSF